MSLFQLWQYQLTQCARTDLGLASCSFSQSGGPPKMQCGDWPLYEGLLGQVTLFSRILTVCLFSGLSHGHWQPEPAHYCGPRAHVCPCDGWCCLHVAWRPYASWFRVRFHSEVIVMCLSSPLVYLFWWCSGPMCWEPFPERYQ